MCKWGRTGCPHPPNELGSCLTEEQWHTVNGKPGKGRTTMIKVYALTELVLLFKESICLSNWLKLIGYNATVIVQTYLFDTEGLEIFYIFAPVLQVSGGVHIHALESDNNLILHIKMRQEEIEPLLQEWKSQIRSSRMIFGKRSGEYLYEQTDIM